MGLSSFAVERNV